MITLFGSKPMNDNCLFILSSGAAVVYNMFLLFLLQLHGFNQQMSLIAMFRVNSVTLGELKKQKENWIQMQNSLIKTNITKPENQGTDSRMSTTTMYIHVGQDLTKITGNTEV